MKKNAWIFSATIGAVLACGPTATAGNIESPESQLPLRRLAAFEGGCGTGHYTQKTLTTQSLLSTFYVGSTEQAQLIGITNLQLTVDPASGIHFSNEDSDFTNLINGVSVETGTFTFVGTSEEIGISQPTILIAGRVVGTVFQEDGQITTLIDVTVKHPAVVEEYGDFESIDYIELPGPFFPLDSDNELFPWTDEREPQSDFCTGFAPFIDLITEPVPPPAPITFALTAALTVPAQNECPIADFFPVDVLNFTYTFDANTRDVDIRDNDKGVYFSCDDAYGALTGAKITLANQRFDESCIGIIIENDKLNDLGQTVDRYSVVLGDRSAVGGTILVLEDPTATAFDDDSLPAVPPNFAAGGAFIVPTMANTEIRAAGFCTAEISPLSLVPIGDTDFDGVNDAVDNCTLRSNSRQRDTDGDLYGNACDPDLNNDGVVNVLDVGQFKGAFFERGDSASDFNSDGVVNFSDLARMRQMFFGPPGPSAVDIAR